MFARELNHVRCSPKNCIHDNMLIFVGTRVTKCAEGLYNKAFILAMDNGREVFAKLPNPNAGPARYTIASEIATCKLVSNISDLPLLYPILYSNLQLFGVLKIPVTRVLTWSFDAASNPVGAGYIIRERHRVCVSALFGVNCLEIQSSN
jgi:hypothetical protein